MAGIITVSVSWCLIAAAAVVGYFERMRLLDNGRVNDRFVQRKDEGNALFFVDQEKGREGTKLRLSSCCLNMKVTITLLLREESNMRC